MDMHHVPWRPHESQNTTEEHGEENVPRTTQGLGQVSTDSVVRVPRSTTSQHRILTIRVTIRENREMTHASTEETVDSR